MSDIWICFSFNSLGNSTFKKFAQVFAEVLIFKFNFLHSLTVFSKKVEIVSSEINKLESYSDK